MIVVHILALRRSLLCAVVHILHIGELELLSCISSIGVRQIIASIQCAVELHVVLSQMLALRFDAVHIVVAHGKGVHYSCRYHNLISRIISSLRNTNKSIGKGLGIDIESNIISLIIQFPFIKAKYAGYPA